MYGAIIGDIVGSKYEFDNIKTKSFPLFSRGCDFTDDTIMTVAVAKAIMLSYHEHCERGVRGKGFQGFLVETMQDFGRRYPYPLGAYGIHFSGWLRQQNPKPYGSCGNGSAMRVSPCALAAVSMDEALALARASAEVTHNHPEGVKGAEAVSAAIFLAKSGKSKEEIRQHISEHYYDLDFTLDSIRDSYKFDGTCQGSVPQAIVAFLESENFEDAIRNVISIGGDCDTTGAITGSIAWMYYAMQSVGEKGWAANEFDRDMQEIKSQAAGYLPKEIVDIADEFHDFCYGRASFHCRAGFITSILNSAEIGKYWMVLETQSVQDDKATDSLSCEQKPGYTLQYIMAQDGCSGERVPGACSVRYDKSLGKWQLKIQLDNERLWYLSVFVRDDGSFEKYSLDEEAANDSHYEFVEEQKIREKLYVPGDENKYFHEILIRYIQEHGNTALYGLIKPYVTQQFHF